MKRIVLSLGLLIVFCIGCSSFAGNALIDNTEIIQLTEEYHHGLSENEVETLESLQLVDAFPLYTMQYVGDYNSSGTVGNLTFSSDKYQNSWACTLFTALADDSAMVYGRNFDWDYSPVLLLYADPPGGYSSVTIVDLAYFGFSPEEISRLSELPLSERVSLLDAPWWPFDGMNEHGLVIGMAAVPSGNMTDDPQKKTIGSLEIMRKVLDNAKNIDEALEIFQDFNIDMRGGPDLHYLIADRSGQAVLIEFYRGEMLVIPNNEPWHLAANFLCSSVNGSLEGNCRRYDTVLDHFTEFGGALRPEDGMNLLDSVSQAGTQWSVIYSMSTGRVDLVVGQEYENVHSFNFSLSEE